MTVTQQPAVDITNDGEDPSRSGPFADPITTGSMEIRLAESDEERAAAQRLRYQVFYEEMKAKPTAQMAAARRDFDKIDDVADHLLVLDHDRGTGVDAVVGTYRLIRREAAAKLGQFYSADEYDISALEKTFTGEVLELGRSCVDEDYRTRQVMELLWRGIAAYVFHYDIEVMFGCASMPGNDVEALALPLSYLYHNHLAPEDRRPVALPDQYVPMNRIPAEEIDMKQGLRAVPPLIKGYLRLGGYIGDGAVIDPQFNTVDVCVVVETKQVTDRYYKHYAKRTGND